MNYARAVRPRLLFLFRIYFLELTVDIDKFTEAEMYKKKIYGDGKR